MKGFGGCEQHFRSRFVLISIVRMLTGRPEEAAVVFGIGAKNEGHHKW